MAAKPKVLWFDCALDPEHDSGVQSILQVQDRVWCGCGDGGLAIWSIPERRRILVVKHHTKAITSLALIDNRVWTTSRDSTIGVWDTQVRVPVPAILK
jgi:WD40 repeat protein